MHLYVPRSAREELKALGPEFRKAYNVSDSKQVKENGRAPAVFWVANVCGLNPTSRGCFNIYHGECDGCTCSISLKRGYVEDKLWGKKVRNLLGPMAGFRFPSQQGKPLWTQDLLSKSALTPPGIYFHLGFNPTAPISSR